MKITFISLGIVFIIIGFIDLLGSYIYFDLWGDFLNIQLPETLWQLSAYLEILLGVVLYKLAFKFEQKA